MLRQLLVQRNTIARRLTQVSHNPARYRSPLRTFTTTRQHLSSTAKDPSSTTSTKSKTRTKALPITISSLTLTTLILLFYISSNNPKTHQCDIPDSLPASDDSIPDGEPLGRKQINKASRSISSELDTSEPTVWALFTDKLASATDTILDLPPSISTITDTIIDAVLPEWALNLGVQISKLQRQLIEGEEGNIVDEIWQDAMDPFQTPEIQWNARVRISRNLCLEEQIFLKRRRRFTRIALKKYLNLPKDEIVHEEDIPTIAIAGSGGGLRAMIASAGSYQRAKEVGLFDCATYTAGVSGSTWLQSLFYSSIGHGDFGAVIEHIKARVNTHIAYPPAALDLLNKNPTGRYLLRGVVERLKVGYSGFHLVDAYGLLLAARLMVPKDELAVDDADLKISKQERWCRVGENPLPIYTAVRHEIPISESDGDNIKESTKEEAIKEDWFQWFELTPYEFYCEELEAGIPTWALGRKFDNGINVDTRVPELKLPTLFGIFGSAFCATLSHYYNEVRPFIKSLPTVFWNIDDLISDRNADLSKLHPITPATLPNPIYNLPPSLLPPTTPSSLTSPLQTDIHLMDAGMSNNLPLYPLMRQDRNVDVMVIFDSSADIETSNWIGVAEGYARQKKVLGWPVGAGWPQEGKSVERSVRELESAQAESVEEAETKVEREKTKEMVSSEVGRRLTEVVEDQIVQNSERNLTERERQARKLGYCTVWVGSKAERDADKEPPPSKEEEGEDWALQRPEAGMALIYLPLIPNPKCPGVNPETSPFCSTWNFEWNEEQVDELVRLARANFMEGEERIRRTVRAVYERKKRERERRGRYWEEVVRRVREHNGEGRRGFERGVWGFK